METFIYSKIVDQSALEKGISVPAKYQSKLYECLGLTAKRGQNFKIDIYIENLKFEATLRNEDFDEKKYPSHKNTDVVQVIFSKKSGIKDYINSKFKSTLFIVEYNKQHKDEKIKQKQPEYIDVFSTGNPKELLFKLRFNDESINKKHTMDRLCAYYMKEQELLKKIKHQSKAEINEKKGLTTSKERNPYIAEYAKRRAHGKCQLCNQDAPFVDYYDRPYLESHHIEWLANGGEDTIENTVALCPNCHRKIHILNNADDTDYLRSIQKFLSPFDEN